MEQETKNDLNELNLKTYSFTIENVCFMIKTDNTFVMPSTQSINALDYKAIHHHVNHELFFITDGELYLNLKNESTTYHNCIVHVPAFIQHFSKASSLIYRFMVNYKKQNDAKPSSLYKLVEKIFTQSTVQTFSISNSILNYLKELDVLLKSNRIQKEVSITSLLTCIILELLNSANNENEAPKDSANPDYTSRLEYIFNNQIYSENLTLDFIAKELSLSAKQVSRVIKKNYNASLTDIINDKKLSASCLLLKNTDYSIAEIIKHVNFKTENYFFTLFKKRYGITPLKYRRLYSNNK